jgi:inner membrane protein
MDPLTQSLLGGVAAHAACGRRLGRGAFLAGMVSGGIADLDLLWTGLGDPAVPFELHRHFTHALVFIPAGALVATLALFLWRRCRASPRWTYLACLVGYATHAPLDLCTSYGTLIYWPFTSSREAIDIVAVIDPIFTGVLLVGGMAAMVRRSTRWSTAALLLGALYLGLGALQRERAQEAQAHLAARRGHTPERSRVLPTLGNLLVWRSIYLYRGELHVDAARLPPLGRAAVRADGQLPVFRRETLPPRLQQDPRTQHVLEVFLEFADDYVARLPGQPGVIGDLRYSLAGGLQPIWGVHLGEDGGGPRWMDFHEHRPRALEALWLDLTDPGRFR